MKGKGAMRHRYIRRFSAAACIVVLVLSLAGCSTKKSKGSVARNQSGAAQEAQEQDGNAKIALPYNTTLKAIVMKVDALAGVIQLQNASGGLGYTLTFGSGTNVIDKYGTLRVMDEVKPGDVVEAYIDDTNGTLAGLCYSKENWEFKGSTNWKFNTEKTELTIGKDKYYYNEVVVLSEGKEINIMDLNKSDILNIQGSGKKVLSVTVEQGHGYVKLEGVDDFIGGWVEIGKVIKPVSKDMLIVVPEGNWDVKIVKDGYGGALTATVARNEESTVDFSEIANSIVRYGTVEFTIEPEDAKLYIAGREMDYSSQILLEYDTYKIRVSADGYKDYTGDLKVEKALTGKKITLEKEGQATTPPAASASPSPSAGATTNPSAEPLPSENADEKTMSDYNIKVTAPEGVNVYFDDMYVGISPVNIVKKTGDHTITLSKAGYVTKSYSVEIGEEEKDVTFELPDLEYQR